MKIFSILLLYLMLPAIGFCQSVNMPAVGASEDPSTTISKIEVTHNNTIITFKHFSDKGKWVQINKSMYLQNANGEERYAFIKCEGIPLRPLKYTATTDNELVEFKVYFEKVKPGTKEINIIERALSPMERSSEIRFFNYYNVSLLKSGKNSSAGYTGVVQDSVHLSAPALTVNSDSVMSDNIFNNFSIVYKNIFNAQLKFYEDPATLERLAGIHKSYYDALIKKGFSKDDAMKICSSKSIFSFEATK
ncbi:hypothetical protein [Pedobacter nutrimenti]|uniref:hypothetical protein n=1 Tax=Pedobacter nutrimenti TaxID=1241337 RepID=UPI00292F51BF|nr:hypothetical protein [Pedobacter nutrimenti]